MKLTTKTSFELNENGKATMQLHASNAMVKSELLTIIERLADLEERSALDLLSELTEIAKMKEEMLPELRAIFDKMFGGK